jgi:flagellar protein FlaI
MAFGLKLSKRRKKKIEIPKDIKEPNFGESPPYLLSYIEKVRKELGEPQKVDRLTGEMKKWREFNVIYPIGYGIFIHAYNEREGGTGYNKYMIIEPPKPHPKLFDL